MKSEHKKKFRKLVLVACGADGPAELTLEEAEELLGYLDEDICDPCLPPVYPSYQEEGEERADREESMLTKANKKFPCETCGGDRFVFNGDSTSACPTCGGKEDSP